VGDRDDAAAGVGEDNRRDADGLKSAREVAGVRRAHELQA